MEKYHMSDPVRDYITIAQYAGERDFAVEQPAHETLKKNFSMIILMLTDVLMEGTQIVYLGDDEIIHQAFNITPKDNTLFLPHVMSRKKQVIPMLSALWG